MAQKRANVILVLADRVLARVYERKFAAEGWTAVVCESVLEAERKAVRLRPRALVLDGRLAGNAVAEYERVRHLPTMHQTRCLLFVDGNDVQTASELLVAHRHLAVDDVLLAAHLTPEELVRRVKRMAA